MVMKARRTSQPRFSGRLSSRGPTDVARVDDRGTSSDIPLARAETIAERCMPALAGVFPAAQGNDGELFGKGRIPEFSSPWAKHGLRVVPPW